MGIIRAGLIALAGIWCIAFAGTYVFATTHSQPSAFPMRSAIVVLSGDYDAGFIGKQTQARVDAGIALWQDGHAPLLIMSGGTVLPEMDIAADQMRQRAIAAGVAPGAVRSEIRSHSTLQNAVFTGEKLGNPPAGGIYLVTHRFHLARSWASFWWAGFDDITLVAADQNQPLLSMALLAEGIKWPLNVARVALAETARVLGVPDKYIWVLLH